MGQNLPAPPSSITGPIRDYLVLIQRAVNGLPVISQFSGTDPNSTVTGLPGHIAVNVGSASTDSRIWVLGGANQSRLTNHGWVAVRTLA